MEHEANGEFFFFYKKIPLFLTCRSVASEDKQALDLWLLSGDAAKMVDLLEPSQSAYLISGPSASHHWLLGTFSLDCQLRQDSSK